MANYKRRSNLRGQDLGAADIALLAALVSTAQQDHHALADLGEIDAVARADVDT